jgi:hypothetical protein
MFTKTNGITPGTVTPENDKGVVTGHGNNPQNTTNNTSDFKSKIIAMYARIKGATSGFYLDRAIGADSILMAALTAVYLVWRALA